MRISDGSSDVCSSDLDGQPDAEQANTVPRIGEPAERNPEQGVEDGKGGAVEKADVGVVEPQVAFQVGRQDGDDLPVAEIEHIDEEQDDERIPGKIGRAESWERVSQDVEDSVGDETLKKKN